MTFDLAMKRTAKVIAVITIFYHIYIGFYGIDKPLANYAISFSLLTCLVFLYVPFAGIGSRITILMSFSGFCPCSSDAISFQL